MDTPWTRLSSRTARGIMSRKGVAYDELAERLNRIGVYESPRGAEGKIQRGSFRCTFFLQLLHVLNSEYPTQWGSALRAKGTWEDASKHIFIHELSIHSLNFNKLSKRFARAGIIVDESALENQVTSGRYSFSLLLQLALVTPIVGLERFVDFNDIQEAAVESSSVTTFETKLAV